VRAVSHLPSLLFIEAIHRLSEGQNLLLTPFERNLSIWRQLWRTLERSRLVVQIVDARNPLGFRCEDLETYVHEVQSGPEDADAAEAEERKNLLLINKADLLTRGQRCDHSNHWFCSL
jgi:large subunit GTPase 1